MTRRGHTPPHAAPVPRRFARTPEQKAQSNPTVEEVTALMEHAQQELRKTNSDKEYWAAVYDAGKQHRLELQKRARK